MRFILVMLLSFLVFGCVTVDDKKNYVDNNMQKELLNKNIEEILSILEDGHVGYIAEPPCSLSSIFILSRKRLVMVDLKIDNIPIEIRENTITCKWRIEDFYTYYPSMIKVEKIDQAYIEKFDRPFNK